MLKRGMNATIEEWLMAAEYVAQRGNLDIVLCERGIRTFETATRNTLDIWAVPVAHDLEKLSKHPEEFGNGAIEAWPAEGGQQRRGADRFIPMLTLGIPSNPAMALMGARCSSMASSPAPR